jgi:hypothetical protein
VTEPATLPPLVPGYATPGTGHKDVSVTLYRAVIACGALPLVVGVAVVFLYWLTRSKALPVFGLFTILGGLVLGGVAGVLLAIVAWQAWQNDRSMFLAWRKRIVLAILLLGRQLPRRDRVCGVRSATDEDQLPDRAERRHHPG